MAVAIQGYYDGSVSYGVRRSVTLAGYAATPQKWAEFEAAWQGVLAGDGTRPAARLLHMTDAHTLNGEFSAERGWTRAHVESLLNDVARCLNQLGRRDDHEPYSFLGGSCTVPLDDYARAVEQLPNLKRKEPEAICVDCVAQIALGMMAPLEGRAHVDELKKVGSVELFFDQNERFFHKINRIWLQRRVSDRPKVLELVSDLKTGDAKMLAPLQAADYLAWLTNKHLRDKDAAAGARRILSAPMFAFDYTYERLVTDYKNWNGYLAPKKRARAAPRNEGIAATLNGRGGAENGSD
jgi:hypothetical protein